MSSTRTLSTADERREAVLAAAGEVFARRGLHGTPTMAVAKAAGISQAYLFRLFPTKDDLALALVEHTNERLHSAFEVAAAEAKRTGQDPFEAMGVTYVSLIQEPDLLQIQLHAYAASADKPEIREAMRRSFANLYDLVRRETDADDDRIGRFFRYGMALNVLQSLDALELGDDWARVMREDEDGEKPC